MNKSMPFCSVASLFIAIVEEGGITFDGNVAAMSLADLGGG